MLRKLSNDVKQTYGSLFQAPRRTARTESELVAMIKDASEYKKMYSIAINSTEIWPVYKKIMTKLDKATTLAELSAMLNASIAKLPSALDYHSKTFNKCFNKFKDDVETDLMSIDATRKIIKALLTSDDVEAPAPQIEDGAPTTAPQIEDEAPTTAPQIEDEIPIPTLR